MKVLIGLDGSAECEKCVNYVFNLFRADRDSICFLSVFERDSYNVGFIETPVALERVLNQEEINAKKLIRMYESDAIARGFDVKGYFASGGNAAHVLVDQADKLSADIVVVGARGMNGLQRLLLGSVSTYVINHCQRPVLVVTGQGEVHYPRQFMHCYDGSDSSRTAFELCQQLMQHDSTVVCVGVFPPVKMSLPVRIATAEDEDLKETFARANAQGMEALRQSLAEFCANARAKGFGAEPVMKVGDPQSELVEAAREINADIIAIGSRGLTAFERFRLGSVSDHVLHHAPANAVLVLKDAATKDREQEETIIMPTGSVSGH